MSVGTRTLALRDNGVLYRDPDAPESAPSVQAAPAQHSDVHGLGRFAHHPLRYRAGPLCGAAAHSDVAGPEPNPQVGPGVDHWAQSVGPEPELQLPPQLPARLLLLPGMQLELHGSDLFGHRREFLPQLGVAPRRVLAPRGSVLGRGHGHVERVKVVSQYTPQLGLVQVLLLGVQLRVRVLLQLQHGQRVAGNGTQQVEVLARALLDPDAQTKKQNQNRQPATGLIHVL